MVTHRDPTSVTASMLVMLAYSARMSHDGVDLARMGSYWADRLEGMLRSCVADRDVLPADRAIDVRFDEFMADDMAMVSRVYETAGQPVTEDVPPVHGGVHGRPSPRPPWWRPLRPRPIRARRLGAAASACLLLGAVRREVGAMTVAGAALLPGRRACLQPQRGGRKSSAQVPVRYKNP